MGKPALACSPQGSRGANLAWPCWLWPTTDTCWVWVEADDDRFLPVLLFANLWTYSCEWTEIWAELKKKRKRKKAKKKKNKGRDLFDVIAVTWLQLLQHRALSWWSAISSVFLAWVLRPSSIEVREFTGVPLLSPLPPPPPSTSHSSG